METKAEKAKAPSRRTSITDVARVLQVSASTVSRALSDQQDISKATKARVRQVAHAMNYQPNLVAAGLRRGQSKTLGVILPHLSGAFYPTVLHGIEKMASQHGYQVLVCQSHDEVRCEQRRVAALLAAQVEGILIPVSATTLAEVNHLAQVQQAGTGLVFFDRAPADLPGSAAVLLDTYNGAYEAVTHLIKGGSRRIAHFAGPQQVSTSRNCQEGYLAALRDHQLPAREELMYPVSPSCSESGRRGMEYLLKRAYPPDAVFAASAIPLVGALAVLHERGVQIPQQIALAGFSNEPFTTMTQPHLTMVDQRAEQMGQSAVRLLLQLLKRNSQVNHPNVFLKPELIIRDSSRR
ncbi:LacI family DNA-binding transcriptional regulator [Hymenobacter qilianensis]|nr:LacI family DNA-binding transcriptional regulator [Hymenobacter qilianensis]